MRLYANMYVGQWLGRRAGVSGQFCDLGSLVGRRARRELLDAAPVARARSAFALK